jgi:hypothetical protein
MAHDNDSIIIEIVANWVQDQILLIQSGEIPMDDDALRLGARCIHILFNVMHRAMLK